MMQTTAGEIFEFLKLMAPLELQMDFDNAGFLVGDRGRRVEKALLALDATSEVIDEAIDFGADMIITHHPLIWNAMKSLTTDDIMQRRVMKLVKNNISLVSMHTNLDIADGGVNDVLLSMLGADLISALDEDGCGRVGQLREPTDMAHFLPFCKAALRTNGLRYYDAGRPVERLAVMGGAGGSSLERAYELGCDTYLTSDIKYDQFLTARELGINLIDGDHFCTENPVIYALHERLSLAFPGVELRVSQRHDQTARFA